jgi:hypothetical protein
MLNLSILTDTKPIRMKMKTVLPAIFGALLALAFILESCSSPKMSAVSCPDISNGRYAREAGMHNKKKNATATAYHETTSVNRHSGLLRKNNAYNSHASVKRASDDNINVTGAGKITSISKSEYSRALTASADNSLIPGIRSSAGINQNLMAVSYEQAMDIAADQQSGCDTIILKSGSRIIGKVEEIGQSEIRYRRCDNITGPVISIAKSGVNRILYVNGTHEIMVSDSPIVLGSPEVKPVYSHAPVKSEPLGIAGFISGLIGLFIAGVPLGTLAVIFGVISIGKIRREPARFRGRGLAIASVVLGVIAAVGAIIVMSSM